MESIPKVSSIEFDDQKGQLFCWSKKSQIFSKNESELKRIRFVDDFGKRLVFVNQNPLGPEFDRFFDLMIDDDLNDPFMAALFPGLMDQQRFFYHNMYDHRRHGSDAQKEEYCAEIVQQLRQSTNSLIDEMKVTRKEFEEKTADVTKKIVRQIKEMQSQISKALLEELPKVLKDNKHSFEIVSDL